MTNNTTGTAMGRARLHLLPCYCSTGIVGNAKGSSHDIESANAHCSCKHPPVTMLCEYCLHPGNASSRV